MAEPARSKLTYLDLLAVTLPDRDVPELIDGELFYKASPRGTHGYAQGRALVALDEAATPRGGLWWLIVEPDVVFSETRVLRPDLAGWRRERLPTVPDGAIRMVPDWVCEILSPTHEFYDRGTKRRIYAEEGVPYYWLLHPERRTLEAFVLERGRWVVLGTWTDGDVLAIAPFEEQIVDVGSLFAPRDEPPLAHEVSASYRGERRPG